VNASLDADVSETAHASPDLTPIPPMAPIEAQRHREARCHRRLVRVTSSAVGIRQCPPRESVQSVSAVLAAPSACFIRAAGLEPSLPRWYDPQHEPRRVAGGVAIPMGAILPGLRCSDAGIETTVGMGSRIKGPIDVTGSLTLAAACKVDGDVTTKGTATIGPGSRVWAVRGARVVVLPGASAQDIEAAGDVLLLGACSVGTVVAGGDILIAGEPKATGLRPKGRVVTRPW
jgi:cytoskeletal protein CcmA (bactofilin family)